MLRYEELIASPKEVVALVAKHVGIDARRFDPAAIATRVRGAANGPAPEPAPLNARDRAALATPGVRQTALALGYQLDL